MSEHASVPLPEPIAEGRVGIIYPWGEDKILKRARAWVPRSWIEHEFRITSIVQHTGLPIPHAHELIEIEGQVGIIYDRFSGPTMLARAEKAPYTAYMFGKMLGELHAEMHTKSGTIELPDHRTRLREKIRSIPDIPEHHRSKALAILETLPDDNILLHGDFHPDNVMLTETGPIAIDWPDASRGHPLADVARTLVLINLGGIPSHPVLNILVRAFRRVFKHAYLANYFKHSPHNRKDLNRWLFPIIVARLAEGIQSELSASMLWLDKLHHKIP